MALQVFSQPAGLPTAPLRVGQLPAPQPISIAKPAPLPKISTVQPKPAGPISVQPVNQQPKISAVGPVGQQQAYTPKKTAAEFAAAIKAKYPEYKDADDTKLVLAMIQKFPEYASQIDLPTRQDTTPQETYLGMKRDNYLDPQKVFGIGVGALKEIGRSGTRILDQTAGRLANIVTGRGNTPTTTTQDLAPQNTQEKIGSFAAQALEFAAPAGAVSKAQKALDIALDGTKLPSVLKVGAKILGKAAVEGTGAGAVRLAQTGDLKEARNAAVTAGAIKAGTNTIGETLKAFNVPEALYSKIFKTSAKDMQAELKMIGTDAFRQQNPERFKQLVDAGIVKVGKNGKAIVDETLAKEALNRGLSGSLTNMSNATVKNLYENEAAAQAIAKSATKPLKVEKQYVSVLKQVKQEYKDVGFGEISRQADEFLKAIKQGKTDAETALKLRRFLDGMRIQSSFNPTTKLSMSQQNFKYLADNMRNRLAELPGMKATMGEYRFNIEALEALAKEAARRENKDVLGLIDAALLGGGIANGSPFAGATLGLTRRMLNSPSGLTKLGQTIQKGTLTNSGAVLKGGIQLGTRAATQHLNQ